MLIIDEAQNFESVLCNFITMEISEKELKSLGFNTIKIHRIGEELKNVKTVLKFIDFINDFFLGELENMLENMRSLLSNQKITQPEKIKVSKYITNLEGAVEAYKTFSKSMDEGTDDINNWVIDIRKDEIPNKKSLLPASYIVQPVWSEKYLYEVVFKHYDHIIFMSGTILDKNMFAYLNGLEESLCSYFNIKSPFPVKNRPIYFAKGVGKMTFENKKETWEKQKIILDKIINKYSTSKGIIHTTNYEISNWIKEYYKGNDRLLFHTSDDRDKVLYEHLTSTKPTILVSPSMMTGVDLKDDLSRFQVIMKVPYGNLKSEKIKKRLKDNKEWYAWDSCSNLIQMTGRSIRSMDDYCDTFILDDSLSNLLKYNHKYLPEYFTEAIKILKM